MAAVREPRMADDNVMADLKINLNRTSNISILRWTWSGTSSEQLHLRAAYYKPRRVEPFETTEQTIQADREACELNHPEGIVNASGSRLVTCTVKLIFTTDEGKVVQKRQTSWERDADALSGQEEVKQSLDKYFRAKRKRAPKHGDEFRVMWFGPQHAGKSGAINSSNRWLLNQSSAPDIVVSARAGSNATTVRTCYKAVPLPPVTLQLMDSPHYSGSQHTPDLVTLLRDGVPANKSPYEYQSAAKQAPPPDAAVLTVSLMHFKGEREAAEEVLKNMQSVFRKDLSDFPYVVEATHRDKFLEESQAEDPFAALEEAVQAIQGAANTNAVYAVTNFNMNEMPSVESMQQFTEMMRQLIEFATPSDDSWGSLCHAAMRQLEAVPNAPYVLYTVLPVLVMLLWKSR